MKAKDIAKKLAKQLPESQSFSGGDIPEFETVSTGSMILDNALGGGWAKGKFIEVFGKNGCGKTMVALLGIKAAQERGEVCAFVDAERTFNKDQVHGLGIDTEELVYIKPSCGEDGGNSISILIENGVKFIVLDSIAALVPRKETKDAIEQQNIGLHARLMNKLLRVITPLIDEAGCTVIMINQERQTMDMFGGVTTTGGNGIPYYSTQRIQMLKPNRKERTDGMKLRFKVYKNKITHPQDGEFDVFWKGGVNSDYETIVTGLSMGLVERAGAWYSYGEHKTQGIESCLEWGDATLNKLNKEIKDLLSN